LGHEGELVPDSLPEILADGLQTNFAQVYTTFWDRVLGTQWTGDDLSERYERGRRAAERALERNAEETAKCDKGYVAVGS